MAKKILLADDSVTIQKVISITLAHEDFELTIVDNGTEAISKSREIKPDLILLDVVMPDKDGYQVCEEIRRQNETKNIPIILLTGTFEPFDEERATEVGANDFIKKPFESHTLINKVKETVFLGGVDSTIGGDELGFETPIERGTEMEEAESMKGRGAFSDIDMETPREAGSSPKEGGEDIWSVEEFEDIAGHEKSPTDEQADVDSDLWEDIEISSESDIEEGEPAFGGADEEVSLDDSEGIDIDEFELGKEISENELKKFLEEEGVDGDTGLAQDEIIGKDSDQEDFHEVKLDDFDATEEDKGEFFVDDYEVPLDNGEDLPSDTSGDEGKSYTPKVSEESYDVEWGAETDSDFEISDELGEAPEVDTEFISKGTEVDFGEVADFEEYGQDRDAFEGPSVGEKGMVGLVDGVVTDNKRRITEMVAEKVHEAGLVSDRDASQMSEKELSNVVDKIAREVIEKVAWEVVPELAEELIKEEIRRLKGELA